MNLVPLFEEALEFQDYNGTVLSDGKVAVYYIGRTRLADIYTDVEGSVPAENPRILNNLGMGPVYVNPAFDYEMVVFDTYGSELFSVKKYLASKGEHSTANVVVTPSESIAVSAWTVGDVQVYMPYLTGQLGKVYEGIDPIVVNNQVDKISANHVPLGVQDPLYFVQDDEEGCIIGCSAQTEIPSALSGKWDEASDAVIANSAQWAEGTEYEAGSYVDIDGHTINVTGLQPAGNYQSAGDYVVHDELSSYATQDWVENQSYMKEYMESAFYPSTSNPSGYLTAHQDISNKLDTTAFSTVSGDFLTAVPSEYVTENTLQSGLSSKLDSSAFSTVSGDFLTAHQSLDGLMSADLLEISDNKITGYNGTAFAGQGGVTGDYELVAGSGVELVDDPDAHTTTINVTAEGTPVTAIEQMIGSATSGKTDKTATIYYSDKPSANSIYAYGHSLYNVNSIGGSGVSINQSQLYLSGTVTANTGGFTAAGLSANNNDIYFCIKSRLEAFSGGGGAGFTFSSQNSALGTARLTVNYYTNPIIQVYSPKFEARNISGAGFSIEASAAKGYDHNGNVVWDTYNPPAPTQLIAGTDSPKPSILLSPYMPKNMSAQFSQAPLFSADGYGIYIGISGQYVKTQMGGLTARNGFINAEIADNSGNVTGYTEINGGEVSVYHSSAFGSANSGTWALTQSVQKREIECDTATSAITAIAGSAIGGGGVPQSAFDEATAKIAELENILSSYSGQWLLA